MARRKQKSRRNKRLNKGKNSIELRKRRGESVLTKDELHLNKHDEEKLLLFTAGMLFGIGIAAGILGAMLYAGIVALVMALIILLVEARQEMHTK